MDNEVEEQFSWIPMIKREFLKTFSGDYEVGTLESLQQNITDEILKVMCTYDLKRGELLFQCIEYFYYHFCRKWYQSKKFSPYMEDVWVHILFSFIKVGLLLSKGKKKSKWINLVSTAIKRFPGGNNLIYDALLSVNCLNKKYQSVYGSILMHLLIYLSSFVPLIINDPADYLKVCLLFRRLKFLVKDHAEKLEIQMKASKILAPSTLSSWLLSHDFSVTWMKNVLTINLQINIFKKLKGKKYEKEVVDTIRKILLPRMCTERKSKVERLHSGLNEVDQQNIKKKNIPANFGSMAYDVTTTDKEFSVYETNIKNKIRKKKRNYINEDGKTQIQLEKSTEQQQNAFLCNKEFEAESKSKKKKLRKCLLVTSNDLSLLENTSTFLETTKNITKNSKTNSKGKVALKNHTSNEIPDICIGRSSPLKNSHQDYHNKLLCASSGSDLADECLFSEKEVILSSSKQTNVKDDECRQEDCCIAFSPKMKKHSNCINLSDEQSSRNLAVQIGNLNSSNQSLDFVEKFKDKKSDLSSESFGDNSKKLSVPVDFMKEIPCEIDVSQDTPALKVHGSCLPNHSSLYVDSCDKVQEQDYTSFKTDGDHKLKFRKTNCIDTAKSNSEVIIKGKLLFENNPLPCVENNSLPCTKKDKMMQEKIVSSNGKSTNDLPLSNISFSKIGEISLEKVIETVIYDLIHNVDCMELKSEAPLEHSITHLLENKKNAQSIDYPLTVNISSQEIEIGKDKLVANSSSPIINDTQVVFNSGSFEGQSQYGSSCELLDYPVIEPLKASSSALKTEDSQFSGDNQILNENQNLDVKANNTEVKIQNSSIEVNIPNSCKSSDKINTSDTVKILNSSEVKTSDSSIDFKTPNSSHKVKTTNSNDKAKTPNSSAASGLMENVLNLVELASCAKDESIKQNILKGCISSTVNNLSLEFISCRTSNKIGTPSKCLTFLDIYTENDKSHNEIQSAYHISKSTEFLKYRDMSNDQDDASKVIFSENKSILKVVASEPSDSNSDAEDEESNSSSDCNSHVSFSDDGPLATNSKNNGMCDAKEVSYESAIERNLFDKDGESNIKELQEIEIDVCTKNKTSKEEMLNPVVYLGRRCDSTTCISVNSSVSADLSPLPGFKSSNEKIDNTKPLVCSQIPSTINLNYDIIEKPDAHSNLLEKQEEISEAKIVKVEIQPYQKDVKEFCSAADQELNFSDKSQDSVEHTCKLLKDIKSNKCKDLTVCNKDQESFEQKDSKCNIDQEFVCDEGEESMKLTSEKDLSQYEKNTNSKIGQKIIENRKDDCILSPGMKLRKRPAVVQTEKSAFVKEDCSMLNQKPPVTSGSMSLRNRNPHVSSNQEVRKRESNSRNATKRSSKRLKKEVNVNLGFDFSELSLNSPKTVRSKPNDSSNENNSEFVKDNVEPPTKNIVNSCRRLTRASIISSNNDSVIKDQESDLEGYNLRSRKPIILPGKLKF